MHSHFPVKCFRTAAAGIWGQREVVGRDDTHAESRFLIRDAKA